MSDQYETADRNATELEQTLRRMLRKHIDESRKCILADVEKRLKQSDDDVEALKTADAFARAASENLRRRRLHCKVGLFVSVIGHYRMMLGDSAKNIISQPTPSKATI